MSQHFIINPKKNISILVPDLCTKGHLRPSTFVFGQTRPYTNMWLHIGMKLIKKVHFTLGSILSSISPLEFQ
jgi:hypothetical protein